MIKEQRLLIGGHGKKHFQAGEREGRFLLTVKDCETMQRAEIEINESAAAWLSTMLKHWLLCGR